ncbi:5-histidylcysteine sulfoxide synthase [Alteromonas aestuariivivens]|uniref:5-histidylcysteine sulfoxide synthase n=1 Tax=Alteromonas aestuariivivens TaxID=1938339 RepID=A0A3D8M2J0_9ALTE|nr:5-histidylcysteine sulfoxide synthase [Alteromonas aestuariivivens]RDV23927.1 5-histidylcysteine sulfoxide synthase [Alteromonas aestuariivivens]
MQQLPTPNLREGSVEQKRQEILAYFLNAYDTYEALFSNLANDDAFYQRPEKLRHPLIFYYGHTATFFINKLILAKQLNQRINPQFESMFAIGVDEMSWDDLNDDHYDWPEVQQVRDYRRQVKARVCDVIARLEFTMPIDWNSPMWPVIMGIEHERIHLETSSVLIRQLPLEWIAPQPEWRLCLERGQAPENTLIAVEGGKVSQSKRQDGDYYGWDNEYGQMNAEVEAFRTSRYLVSNGEFLAFVEAGGYLEDRYWQPEGLKWRQYTHAMYPVFWRSTDTGYIYRAMTEEFPLPLNWPVEVNYHEAKAFCNWKSAQLGKPIRLPTENEWMRLRDSVGLTQVLYTDGANLQLCQYASSVPVNWHAQGDFFDVVGNVWQWTETPIYPFPGFDVHPLYDDFTTPTFDNKHNLIKGGSWISSGNEATRDCRYAFRRHFYQHAGFRYVESAKTIQVSDMDYESDTQVSQYCEFHYGDRYFDVGNYPQRCAQICLQFMHGKPTRRALDLGCAVGRASFELAKLFEQVDGIDFSARFIKTAIQLQSSGELRYQLVDEGDLTSFRVRRLQELGLIAVSHKVNFAQGDGCNLKPMYDNYDLIFMGNLLDRVYNPRKLLQTVTERLNIGGVLVITSPYTWLTDYTQREHWLGGYKDATGETLTSTDALEQALQDNFERLAPPQDLPFVIRETRRKFQHTVAELNAFVRTE